MTVKNKVRFLFYNWTNLHPYARIGMIGRFCKNAGPKPKMERSGMGFAFMEAFMDTLEVESSTGKGTRVKMTKHIQGECEE